LPTEVVEASDHLEVLEARQVLVDGGVLAREADVLPDPGCVAHDVEARHSRRALVGLEERRQDPDGGCLAGAVRAQKAEDDSRLDAEVDSPKSVDIAVALSERLCLHCSPAGGHSLTLPARLRRASTDNPHFVGEDYRLYAVSQPELHKDPFHVGLDCRLFDEERFGDLAVGEPAGDKLQHLVLSRRERVKPPARRDR
jgi:hypothetical protein